jgi:hypothetical protein
MPTLVGKCRSNAYNEERSSKRPKKGDDKADSMAVTVEEVDIIADSLVDFSAIINDDPSDIDTYSVECYVHVAAIIADHHMNTVSFSAEQEQPKGDFVLDDVLNTVSNEIYSIEDDNITFKGLRTDVAWIIVDDGRKIGQRFSDNIDFLYRNSHAVSLIVSFLGAYGRAFFMVGVGAAFAPRVSHARMERTRVGIVDDDIH